jgi:hypothetical protein
MLLFIYFLMHRFNTNLKFFRCPWIGLQLANTKKVQQVLATRKSVERFLADPKDIQAVYATFAGLWGLENEDAETNAIVKVNF